jgi:hypothetical protein
MLSEMIVSDVMLLRKVVPIVDMMLEDMVVITINPLNPSLQKLPTGTLMLHLAGVVLKLPLLVLLPVDGVPPNLHLLLLQSKLLLHLHLLLLQSKLLLHLHLLLLQSKLLLPLQSKLLLPLLVDGVKLLLSLVVDGVKLPLLVTVLVGKSL